MLMLCFAIISSGCNPTFAKASLPALSGKSHQAAHTALGIQPSHESAKLSRAARVRRRIALAFKEMGLTERTSTAKVAGPDYAKQPK